MTSASVSIALSAEAKGESEAGRKFGSYVRSCAGRAPVTFPTKATSRHQIDSSNADHSKSKTNAIPQRGESGRIMFLVVLYFAIMLLPLLIAVTVSAFHNLAERYRHLSHARAACERIRTAVEPVPASA